jgi:2,5-dioxopentanoate dehydrogenase
VLTGRDLIAGAWVPGAPQNVAAACVAAEAAFAPYAALPRTARAAFLERIADEIDARGPEITAIGTAETGLPAARLEGERGRTTGQLRLFASHIRAGSYLDHRVDAALPDRAPLPRPEIRMIQRPVGPVAVFGASNFPLAFSTAGGDTASALAAGCPVVVKGHPAHPGTGEVVGRAIAAAIADCGVNPGVFALVQGHGIETGHALVTHPAITAVGFTGGLAGGRALFDLCAQRPVPIPFFGELGSVNPMFVLPAAMAARGAAIATAWAASLTMGTGQFCTNPGVVVVVDGAGADAFADAAEAALAKVAAQTMLTDGIASAYLRGRDAMAAISGVQVRLTSDVPGRQATPALLEVSGADWQANPALTHEVFGPLGLIVRVADLDELRTIAAGLDGQLTCTLHLDHEDHPMARTLLPILARKAGRLLANGFPTGVEVCDAMVHGGPFPASTNFGATSVGTLAIRRWLRPVAYQNMPAGLLDDDAGG